MEKKIYSLGYWNSNDVAVAIVAVANYLEDGELFDWAAYIGGTTRTEHEEDALEDVTKWGCKLDRYLASYLARRSAYPLPVECFRD